jgi:hypothetical protein
MGYVSSPPCCGRGIGAMQAHALPEVADNDVGVRLTTLRAVSSARRAAPARSDKTGEDRVCRGCAVLHALDATLARRYSEGATIPTT